MRAPEEQRVTQGVDVDSIRVENDAVHAHSRGDRAKLLGFGVLMLVAGGGLAVVAGPPRLPSSVPRLGDALQVLGGASLPLDALLLVLLDAAWAVWIWIVLSLLLEVLLLAADV